MCQAAADSCAVPRLFEQVITKDVGGQLGVRREAHLLGEPAAVGANGLRADIHLAGDFLEGLARCDAHQHLVFAIGELLMRSL